MRRVAATGACTRWGGERWCEWRERQTHTQRRREQVHTDSTSYRSGTTDSSRKQVRADHDDERQRLILLRSTRVQDEATRKGTSAHA
jgi:hypothetical protein